MIDLKPGECHYVAADQVAQVVAQHGLVHVLVVMKDGERIAIAADNVLETARRIRGAVEHELRLLSWRSVNLNEEVAFPKDPRHG